MKLHEYQAKERFRRFHIPVPPGRIATNGDEAFTAAEALNGPPWVVKAQVHAGGRGKGGGVRIAHTLAEVRAAAEAILAAPLITKQTGPEGRKVSRILVEEGVEIVSELYLAITVDRASARPVIFSQAGGMDIEDVAEKTPDLIQKEYVDPDVGWMPFQGRNLVYSLNPVPDSKPAGELMRMMAHLYTLFMDHDCSLAEINPLVLSKDGTCWALDAKITIDDNALYRQKELHGLDDHGEKDPLEVKASEFNLNYIRLDGNVGAMVNGAGLAMATMDLIKMAGAEPANFLDVGGGASEEMITRGFKIILEDKKVRAVLINIFGGILRCDVLARGLLAAAEKTNIQVPLIVRLEGTNVEEGRRILEDSNLEFNVAGSIAEAAQLVTQQI